MDSSLSAAINTINSRFEQTAVAVAALLDAARHSELVNRPSGGKPAAAAERIDGALFQFQETLRHWIAETARREALDSTPQQPRNHQEDR